jgi:hypothetical protein
MRGAVNGGDQVQVQVQVKATVNDDVHDDDHVDVNGLANYPTRCS